MLAAAIGSSGVHALHGRQRRKFAAAAAAGPVNGVMASRTQVPDFGHGHPLLAVGRADNTLLTRIGECPPSPSRGIRCQCCHIGGVVVTQVFVIANQQIFVEEDRVGADVCHGDRCAHLRPHLGVKLEVFLTVLRTESDNGGETLEA